MTVVKYRLAESADFAFLTVVSPEGEPLVATRETHTNFDELIAAARAGDPVVFDLFDTGKVIERRFRDAANGRVTVRGGEVFFDDDPLDSAIADKILDFVEADEDFSPLARYVENVMANPQKESREQFYRWISGEGHHFPISDDGCIVAYKGVNPDGKGGYQSVNSGTAFVNNVEITGRIPNAPGDTVTMPRSEVQFDPNVACHKGLHAGTWSYASTFGGGTVMLVKINPRDVVSVPHDCTSQKVRVCRYEVIGFATSQSDALRYVDEVVAGDAVKAAAEDEVTLDVPKAPAKADGVFADRDKIVLKFGHAGKRNYTEAQKPFADFVGKRGVVAGPPVAGINGGGYAYVYVGGDKISVYLDELEHDTTVAPSNTVRDTRDNHKTQKRDRFGHFIKG